MGEICWRSRMLAVMRSRSKLWRRGRGIEGGIGTGIEMEEIGKETEETTIEIDDMMIEKGEKRGEEVVVVEKMTCLLRKLISSELSLDCLLSNKERTVAV